MSNDGPVFQLGALWIAVISGGTPPLVRLVLWDAFEPIFYFIRATGLFSIIGVWYERAEFLTREFKRGAR